MNMWPRHRPNSNLTQPNAGLRRGYEPRTHESQPSNFHDPNLRREPGDHGRSVALPAPRYLPQPCVPHSVLILPECGSPARACAPPGWGWGCCLLRTHRAPVQVLSTFLGLREAGRGGGLGELESPKSFWGLGSRFERPCDSHAKKWQGGSSDLRCRNSNGIGRVAIAQRWATAVHAVHCASWGVVRPWRSVKESKRARSRSFSYSEM